MTKAIKDLYSDSNKINYGITCSKEYTKINALCSKIHSRLNSKISILVCDSVSDFVEVFDFQMVLQFNYRVNTCTT